MTAKPSVLVPSVGSQPRPSVLVSFCLFGDDPHDIYKGGLLENLRMYQEWQPTWTCRVYLGKTPMADSAFMGQLGLYQKADIRPQPDEVEDQRSTLWRFQALHHPVHDVVLFRDCDSRPCERERVAVDNFLASEFFFHTMRDHPLHSAPMLAGLWGMRSSVAHKVYRLLEKHIGRSKSYYGVDQTLLKYLVWPLAKTSLLSHVSCEHTYGDTPSAFPTPRADGHFVGAGYYADGRPRKPQDHLMVWPEEDGLVYPQEPSGIYS